MARSQETETQGPAASPQEARGTLGVGMVGYAFMGAAHSQGWRTADTSSTCPCDPLSPRSADATVRRSTPPQPGTAGRPRRPTGGH